MAKLRFGIVGCGVIGPAHARAIRGLSADAELVAVADALPERAEKLAREFGCDWSGDMLQLLRRADLDAVCICTPSGQHAEHAITALQAGKHVVIEKPVDVNLSRIDELLAVQRATGRKVAVISQHRFDLAARIVHDAMQAGQFGRTTLASAQVRWWRSQGYYDSGAWRGTWAMDGGGALMNQSIHTIDLLQWLMGPVVEVSAYTGLLAHERIEVEDTAVAAVRFASGALGVIQGTTAAYPGLTARLELHGTRGSAVIDADRLTYFHAAPADAAEAPYGISGDANQVATLLARYAAAGKDAPLDAHTEQIRDFIAAVREDREPLVSGAEGRKAVAIILAIYESARTQRPVQVR